MNAHDVHGIFHNWMNMLDGILLGLARTVYLHHI